MAGLGIASGSALRDLKVVEPEALGRGRRCHARSPRLSSRMGRGEGGYSDGKLMACLVGKVEELSGEGTS